MIYLGSDHGGFQLKEKIRGWLEEWRIEFRDVGATEFNGDDDYPDTVKLVAEAVSKDPDKSKGIVVGGSGQAEMMLANKFSGVRCALFYGPAIPTEAVDIKGRISMDPFEIIRLTREHNNSNMLSIGARFVKEIDTQKALHKWLQEPFSKDTRHMRRINKILEIEKEITNDGCCGGGCCGDD